MIKRMLYRIEGRYMRGTTVTDYYLIDQNGNKHRMSKDEVGRLALNKQIVNCVAQQYGGQIVMKGLNCKLNQLPILRDNDPNIVIVNNPSRFTTLLITMRIIQNRRVVGYVLRDYAGNEQCVQKEQVISLAATGKVSNARVQRSQGKSILRGVNCNLAELPAYTI